MKNSLKQMMRTPVRTIFFLILMILAALLMTLGACIWQKGNSTMAQYEDRFMTIGTIRQIPDSFEQTLQWNAETKDYDVIKKAQYRSYYTSDDMLFPEAEYIAGPEQRAFYISYAPEYLMLHKSMNPDSISYGSLIAEFSPIEDCMPDESVKIKITKVIGGDPRLEGVVDYFCDHNNPNPEMLYQDKTYIAVLRHASTFLHGKVYDELMSSKNEVHIGLEYHPDSLESGLWMSDGNKLEDTFLDGKKIFEVTEGFYETETGRRFMNLGTMETAWQYSQPVTGTNKTCLLMPFYNGQSYICEGRDISEEEYASGSKVCLAPKTFMKNNGLSLGDTVNTHLLCTDTKVNAGRKFWLDGSVGFYSGLIDTEGNPIKVFESSAYTIVGVYDVTFSGSESIFDPGADELIVPMKSIETKNAVNLMNCGPMTAATSSFQIPNGSIDTFLKNWTQYGTDKLEFTFYDGGYSQLKAGIENMKKVSLCLLTAGVVLTALLLFFFSHLFITKQSHRTAVERSLGMKPVQCKRSILSGFALLLLIGTVIGSLAGAKISNRFSIANAEQTYYDTLYTAGLTDSANNITIEEVADNKTPAACCTIFIMVSGIGIAWVKMNQILKLEPMQLLSRREEE